MASKPFKLRLELQGHSKDVRCVAEVAAPSLGLVSGSRDGSARIWLPSPGEASGAGAYESPVSFVEGGAFVNSLVCLAPREGYPQGLILAGSQSGEIRSFRPEAPGAAEAVLGGHTASVCALSPGDGGLVSALSGSWDKTARVWGWEAAALAVLEGHQAAVWDVAVLPGTAKENRLPSIVTASADRTCALWIDGKQEKTFQGHSDCVRALGVISSSEFLSAANDATIRLWSVATAETLRTFHGHENYIYCLSVFPGGREFVTGSEDRSLRLWSLEDETPAQTLVLPAHSVWATRVLSNGDVVTGSSDGVIRIFTREESRAADASSALAYDALVTEFASTLEASDEIGGIKISDMPGPEILNQPGKKDGQQVMVRMGSGRVELHKWTAGEDKWEKLGDVVGDKKAAEGKKMYLGKEYDFVFDVDIDDNRPKIKLPYNITEDPWMAAQSWISLNELPQGYLDQIANFIITNAPGAGTGAQAGGGGDPLTGDRYIPGSASNGGGGGAMDGEDPLTGGGRYVPGSANGGGHSAFSGGDPLTSEGRYIPGGGGAGFTPVANLSKDVRRPVTEDMPLREWKTFPTVSAKPLMEKLGEFNASDVVGPKSKLLPEDLATIEAVLNGAAAGEQFIKALETALTWPAECLVPVLDVFRLAVLCPSCAAHFLGADRLGPSVVPRLLELLAAAQAKGTAPVQILVARAIANGLGGEGRATILAVEFLRVLGEGLAGLDTSRVGEPVLFLLLQTIVTAMWGDANVINIAKSLKYDKLASRLKDTYSEDNGKTIARAIEHMLEAEIVLD